MTQDSTVNPLEQALARRLRRARLWRSVLLSTVIFAGGLGTGWGWARFGNPPPSALPGTGEPPLPQLVRQLHDELLLSEAQTKQLTDVYVKRYAELRFIRQQIVPKLTKEYDDLRADVLKVLTPEQFAHWNARFLAARNRMLPPERPRGPQPPPGMPPDGPRPFEPGPPGGPDGGRGGIPGDPAPR